MSGKFEAVLTLSAINLLVVLLPPLACAVLLVVLLVAAEAADSRPGAATPGRRPWAALTTRRACRGTLRVAR